MAKTPEAQIRGAFWTYFICLYRFRHSSKGSLTQKAREEAIRALRKNDRDSGAGNRSIEKPENHLMTKPSQKRPRSIKGTGIKGRSIKALRKPK